MGRGRPDGQGPDDTWPGPRGHRDAAFLRRKQDRIDEPHVRALNEFVRAVRRESGGDVPWFDPESGGTAARVLFLYEAPGGKASVGKGSGIVSADNNDPTAASTWQLYREAGVDRSLVLAWNIVPWYLGTTKAIRAATGGDVKAAQPYLARLLNLLPDLRVVVTVGVAAREGWRLFEARSCAPDVTVLACPHPSPRNLNSRPEARVAVLAAFMRAAQICGAPAWPAPPTPG